MASAGSKGGVLARNLKGLSDDESFSPLPAASEAPGRTAPPSLRDRLAEYFRAGHNASDRELAALFGASVGSISVYRCQLKKLGIGVASPPGSRAAMAGKRDRRPGAATKAGRSKRAELSGRGQGGSPRGGSLAPSGARLEAGSPSLAEIDQVLLQNLETELGLIEERYPELARPVANIHQTVRLLLKLHRQ